VLVNNAAVGFGAPGEGRQVSADGHELRFAVNYLAPVLLTRLLVPLMTASAPSRIVNVGSLGQVAFDPADAEFEDGYNGVEAYRRSKLALAAFTFDLAEELRDPGGDTVLSDLSGQEFALLCNAGMRPVGIAAHTSVHYVPASGQTQMAQSSFGGTFGGPGGSWMNQELVDFSQGVYEAREKAMGFVAAQVHGLGGDGVIGVEISEQSRTHAVRRGMYESRDLEVTFHVMGTVVREDATLVSQPPPSPPLQILSLR